MSDSRGGRGGRAADERVSKTRSTKTQATNLENTTPGSPRPHLPPPTQVRPLRLCLQDVVHIQPWRPRKEAGAAVGWRMSTLNALAFSAPKQQENLERVKPEVPVTIFRRCSRKSLLQSKNLSTQSPGRPQGQKRPFASYSAPSSPSLSTKNNFLLGVRWVKKDLITVSVSDLTPPPQGPPCCPAWLSCQ